MLHPTEVSAEVFQGLAVPKEVTTATKSSPWSLWKDFVEGTQRKAGVFASTINNLRAKKEVSLPKI